MAKFLSQVYTIIRGSVGGITYTANASAQLIARARTSPVNPQTNNQTLIRSAFAQGSGFWKQLTQTVRDSWNAYAQTLEFQGPLGPYTVPGRNIFIAIASMVSYINQRYPGTLVFSTVPPTIGGFLDIGDVHVVATSSGETGFGISISNFSGEDAIVTMERSIGYNASRVSPPSKYDSSTFVAEAANDGVSTVVEFNDLTEGAIYFVKVRAITAAGAFRYSSQHVIRAEAIAEPI
jgi:hypothetical protein